MHHEQPSFPRITLISGDFRVQFAANKKWAMSPLISPPAGVHTDETLSDKFVCTPEYRESPGNSMGAAISKDG